MSDAATRAARIREKQQRLQATRPAFREVEVCAPRWLHILFVALAMRAAAAALQYTLPGTPLAWLGWSVKVDPIIMKEFVSAPFTLLAIVALAQCHNNERNIPAIAVDYILARYFFLAAFFCALGGATYWDDFQSSDSVDIGIGTIALGIYGFWALLYIALALAFHVDSRALATIASLYLLAALASAFIFLALLPSFITADSIESGAWMLMFAFMAAQGLNIALAVTIWNHATSWRAGPEEFMAIAADTNPQDAEN